ncbi:15609_t:CDS:2, partial [Gigaspora margarita]
LCCSAQTKWYIRLIATHWYKNEFFKDTNNIWQDSSITLYIDSGHNQSNYECLTYKFDYIKQIRGAEVYSLESDEQTKNVKYNIINPIITKRRERPLGKAKSNVEMQDQYATKDNAYKILNVNQSNNETKNKRKTCQN